MVESGQQTQTSAATHQAALGRRRAALVAVAALLALAVLRTLLVVAPTPMRGYANNYDFVRVSGWFDLWALAPASEPEFDPRAGHHRAPLRCYRIDPSITTHIRYPTTELGFVWLALRVNDAWRALTGPRVCELDLRVLGLVRAAILLGAGCVVTWAFFRRAPSAGVASAAIVAFVLADPAVTLLFNTLYSEFSTILFTYLACALIVWVVAFDRYTIVSALLVGMTFLALAGTKTQFAGLSIVLGTILAAATLVLGARRRGVGAASWGARALVVGVALACAVVGMRAQQHALGSGGYMWSMNMGAATDTFFGAILPLHRDPDRALELIGLPASCRPYVGRTWYDEGMQPPPCPEVGAVSRLRILRLLLDDPALGLRLAARALPMLQPLIVRYYGQVEGLDLAQADARWTTGIMSVSSLIELLPAWLFGLLLGVTAIGGVAAAVIVLASRRSREPAITSDATTLLLPLLVVVTTTVEGYSFASSLLGAGFIDLARHSLTGQLAFLVALPASVALLRRPGRRSVGRP